MENEKNFTTDIIVTDDSLGFLREQKDQGYDGSLVDQKALVRRIDYRIVPLMLCCYWMGFLDKVLINYANVMGLSEDTKLKGNEFSWLATGLFIAFAIAEIPQGFLMQKFPVNRVLGYNFICWGITVALTSACNNFHSLLTVRILLGIFEAVISPALVIITSTWYLKAEAPPRFGIWYCGLGAGQMSGGLISFAFQHVTNTHFQGWRIMFLVVGIINALIGVSVVLFIPPGPLEAKWLSKEEKILAINRVLENQTGMRNSHAKRSQIWDAITDLQVWLMCLCAILTAIPSGVVTTFSATLIRGLGYNGKQSALLNIPGGAVSIISTMIATIIVRKGFPRWATIVITAIPSIIGGALMSFLPTNNQSGLLAGIYLINFITPPLSLIFNMVGSNVAGYTKKIVVNGMVAASFAIANIIGPQTFQAKDAPNYLPAKIALLVVAAGTAVCAIVLRLLLGYRNKKREAFALSLISVTEMEEIAAADLTDRENKHFRYVY